MIDWKKKNAVRIEQNWRRALLKRYGLTLVQYDEMVKAQKGLCAICQKEPEDHRLHVDHNHKTNKTRGLLCRKCNFGIGQFDDQEDLLLAAIEYLRKFND